MKPAPYAFWCRTCKFDHAGECAPKRDDAERVVHGVYRVHSGFRWPGAGTEWRGNDWDPNTGAWRLSPYRYKVLGCSQTRFKGRRVINVVDYAQLTSIGLSAKHSIDLDAWTDNGTLLDDGRRVRMVPA